MVRFALLATFGLGLGLSACSSTDDVKAEDDGGAAVPPPGQPTPGVDAGDDAFLPPLAMPAGYTEVRIPNAEPTRKFKAAEPVLVADQDYVAVLETTAGRIVLDLYETRAPLAVNSFVFLALHRFHEGIAFHRVIEEFMAQTGDPKSIAGKPATWGTGDPGYKFGLEVTPGLGFTEPGVLGMARGNDPGSNGSQFFITFVPYPSLSQQYTVWGKVLEGLEVLPAIVRGEPPAEPSRITRVGIGIRPGTVEPPLSDAGPPEEADAGGPLDAGPAPDAAQ